MKSIIYFYIQYLKSKKSEALHKELLNIITKYNPSKVKYQCLFSLKMCKKASDERTKKQALQWLKLCFSEKNKANALFSLSEEDLAYILLLLLAPLKALYVQQRIDLKVYFASIEDVIYRISSHVKKQHQFFIGKDEVVWLWRIYTLRLFKLGSLEYEITSLSSPDFKDLTIPHFINPTETMLNMHIMDGEDISKQATRQSIALAQKFFNPNIRYYMCYSWLLFEGMRSCLGETSKILEFCSFFEMVENIENPKDTLERLFNCQNLSDAKAETSLQKKVLQTPHSMGRGMGIIKRANL